MSELDRKYERRHRLARAWVAGNKAVRGENWSESSCMDDVLEAYPLGFASRDIVIGCYGIYSVNMSDAEADELASRVLSVIGGDSDA